MSDASPNSIVSASELVVRYGLQTVLDQATLIEHRIKSLISNLRAPDPERNVGELSGGEKRRAVRYAVRAVPLEA